MFKSRFAFLALGLVAGAAVAWSFTRLAPQVPVLAVATHGQDNFAMCTGPMDDEIEAVYVIDFLTGDLKAAVVNFQNGKFNSLFEYNVAKDFATGSTPIKNPKYLLVTGQADLRRAAGAGNVAPSRSLVYVAEITTGQIAAYAVPWNSAMQAQGAPQKGSFVPLDKWKFRNVAIRGAAP